MIRGLFARLLPFVFLGVMIVLLMAGLILLSYLLIAGAIVGITLFLFSWLKEKLFPSKQIQKYQPKTDHGRTFEHDNQQR